MTRGVSTVVDAALCLLLVSAAALALAGVERSPPPERGDAAAVAESLAATTATVDYRLPASAVERDRPRNRTAHGTLASLLADAARLDRRDRPRGFAARVRTHVETWLRGFDARVQVRVDAGSPPPLVVGRSPPPDATVDAATLRVGRARVVARTWSA